MKMFVLVFCISIQILLVSTKKLPENFPAFCSKSERNYNKCMEMALRKMGPYFLKGVPSIDFQNLHPLSVSSVSLDIPLTKNISVTAEIKNLTFYGYNNMELRKFEFDPHSLAGRVALYMPRYSFKFDEYDASGIIDNFRLRNVGYLTGNASEIDLKFYFKLKKIKKMGTDYFTLEKFEATGDIQKVNIKPVSRDPEQQLICDIGASIFNEYSTEIMLLGNAYHDDVLTQVYARLIGDFLSVVPANEIIPK